MPLYDDIQRFLIDHPDLRCRYERDYLVTVLDVLEQITSGITSRLEELDEEEEEEDE